MVKLSLLICPFGHEIAGAGRLPPGQADLNDPSHEMHFEGVVIHPGPSVRRVEREIKKVNMLDNDYM